MRLSFPALRGETDQRGDCGVKVMAERGLLLTDDGTSIPYYDSQVMSIV